MTRVIKVGGRSQLDVALPDALGRRTRQRRDPSSSYMAAATKWGPCSDSTASKRASMAGAA